MSKRQDYIRTKNYKQFQFKRFNRVLNEGLVKRLMKSIQEIGYIAGKPVLVDSNNAIIDGQHRFEACKRLGVEVVYSVINTDADKAVIELNANQEAWTLTDYIQAYAKKGVRCYKEIIDFHEKHPFGISNAITICLGNDNKKSDDIKAGKVFPINPNAERIAEFINDCKVVPYYKKTHFVRAIVKLFTLANDEQLQKIKKNMISLPEQVNSSEYLMAFQNIVNRKVRSKNHVSFKAK